MTFSIWWKIVLASPKRCDDRLEARIRNLAAEDRHVDATKFRDAVASNFAASTPTDFHSAVTAFEKERVALSDVANTFLGLMATSSTPHKAWTPVTFVSGKHIFTRLDPNFDPDASTLAPEVLLPRPLYAAGAKPFIWTSDDAEVANLTPTDIALSLGLPHFQPDDAIYKINLPRWPDEVFVPTCFDAGLYEAWCIPPRSHRQPWGLTRHLVTGDLVHPEILIPLEAVRHEQLVARLVMNDGEDRIKAYTPNFLRKRTSRGIPK